ncbi:hypothetical protein DAI22_05g236550 [Oryza sativa Japonica Group]|nr:hypothetical protein DAI22_05g236550 [Oryza sativa Japonica Group]
MRRDAMRSDGSRRESRDPPPTRPTASERISARHEAAAGRWDPRGPPPPPPRPLPPPPPLSLSLSPSPPPPPLLSPVTGASLSLSLSLSLSPRTAAPRRRRLLGRGRRARAPARRRPSPSSAARRRSGRSPPPSAIPLSHTLSLLPPLHHPPPRCRRELARAFGIGDVGIPPIPSCFSWREISPADGFRTGSLSAPPDPGGEFVPAIRSSGQSGFAFCRLAGQAIFP